MTTGNHGLDALADSIAQRVIEEMKNSQKEQRITPRLLSVDQAAQYLSRTSAAVRRLISSGKLKSVRMDDRVFLDIQDLDRIIEASKGVE